MNLHIVTKTAFVAALMALLFSCTALAGELKVVGTGDGLEMLRSVAEAYEAQNPNTDIVVPPSIGSGGGIVAVGSDTERLGRVARPLKGAEVKYGLVYVPFAKIPSAFFTHPSTQMKQLKSTEIISIYSGTAKSWSEFGGPNMKIKVVRREEEDSTLKVLRATMKGWSDLKLTSRSKLAMTTQEAINTVRTVPGTIGFGPYSHPLSFGTNVLKIGGRFPTDPDYPSAVTLALLYKKHRLDDQMKAFIDFCLSDAAAKVIKKYGGVPIRP